MSDGNEAVVRKLADDFNSGDIPAALGALHPEVEWDEPRRGDLSTDVFKGPQAVGEGAWSPVPEHFDEFQVIIEETEDRGDSVGMTGRYVGKAKNGTELDTPVDVTFDIRDDKVASYSIKLGDPDNWEAAWS